MHAERERDQRGTAAAAERAPLPRRGPAGQRLWTGSRTHLNWVAGAVNAVPAVTPKRLSSRTGSYRYECGKCGKTVLSKAQALGIAKESNWYEIHHVEGIIANVHRSVDFMNWTVQVSYGGAEIVTVGPGGGAYGGGQPYGGHGGQSYGGANVVTVGPGGQAYGGYGGQAYGGRSYGGGEPYDGYGGQASEDPGYDVVTVEPRRRR
ncbi:hypothetical protein [Streptomyces chrestomyceticus]|uniref:Uncharacterized protein n=1 Tax=Streptomyces chrestomyceticus TaxID=68185 RepID=A0ABU7WVJ3_9ACTN